MSIIYMCLSVDIIYDMYASSLSFLVGHLANLFMNAPCRNSAPLAPECF